MLLHMSFLLWYLLCLLLEPCTAFLEVGVSSYLGSTVQHLPELGEWTLVWPWKVSSREGVFDAAASGEREFNESFVTPTPGIYFVALNLHMVNTSNGFVKASLVINDDFQQKNGFEGLYGNTTSQETLSLSGFLRLFENDVLAVYLQGCKGTLLPHSTFSVLLISRIGSVPGFHQVLSSDLSVHMMTRLENFRASGTKGLFVTHSGTSPSVGVFCAILEGIHFFSSNVNVKSQNQLTGSILSIVLNSHTTLVQRYSSGAVKYSISTSGNFYLNRGDCVELRIKPAIGGALTVQLGSSFSGLFLGMKTDSTSQFSASVSVGKQAGKSVGWNKVENWTISKLRRNFQSEYVVLERNSSTFISKTNGIFLVSALVTINVSSNLMERNVATLLVDVNHTSTGFTGYSAIYAGKTTSLTVSGVIWLKKGYALNVHIYSDVHGLEITDGLLGVFLVSKNWPGVAATLSQIIPLDSHGWTKLASWKTTNVPGLFSFDNAFSPNHGVYRTHLDGTYFLSCNVIFKGNPTGNLSAIIAIDEVIDSGNGLFSLNENPKRYTTLNVVGSVKLRKNQTISVYVAATESSSWNVSSKTGFSLVLVGAKSPSAPGFFAVKVMDDSPSSSYGEVHKWKTVVPPFGSIYQKNTQFNSTSGRFEAREDGFYLVSANILIQHSGISKIKLSVSLDGQSGNPALSTFQRIPSHLSRSSFISTLTLAGAIRLTPQQHASLFMDVQFESGPSWKVLSNSSFSIVLVSRWEGDYVAGFLATTNSFGHGENYYTEVYGWNAVFSKNLEVKPFKSVNIKSSGLYFFQSVLILHDLDGNGVFHSGICILKDKILFNGFAASKAGEGLRVQFIISAFGVLFLQKGQNIDLCTRSEKGEGYEFLPGSSFSMTRFPGPIQLPGLYQTFGNVYNASSPCEASFVTSFSTAGNQLAYINNDMFNPNPTSPCRKGVFTVALNGTYFFSLTFTFRENVQENVTACVGPRECQECYIEVFGTLNYQSSTFGFVGLLDLKESEVLSVCFKSRGKHFSLVSGSRSVQFLYEVEANKTVQLSHPSVSFAASGWHGLIGWKTSRGEVVQNIYVKYNGLYIFSTNLVMKVPSVGLLGVRLQTTGATNQVILSILSSAEAGSSVSFSLAVLSRANASQGVSVSVYCDSNSLDIGNSSTFFVALITDSKKHPCLSLKSKTSRYHGGQWWQVIEQWINADTHCMSPNLDVTKGRFVTRVTGVYFVAAVVMVRMLTTFHQTRMVELLVSVNGDTSNSSGLKATKAASSSSTVVLSLSATVYLEVWQTLYLMIRSTSEEILEVLNGSTFSVALIEETKYYKTVAKNISLFDNGPRIIRHPPPSVSLGADLGLNVSWTCEAVSKGAVTYEWLRNDQSITSSNILLLTNVQDSDSGRYICVAEYDGVKVFSQASLLDVFDTSPQFDNQVFTASENSNVSIELNVSALNKQRRPANVLIMIVKGNTNHTFVLSRALPKVNIYLQNQIPFDFETTMLYQLTLVATNQDTNKTTSANVTVIITDINDNPPIFTSSNNTFVEENTPSGNFIFQVRATDADSGNNSVITYSLLPTEYAEKFSIDASSGNITVIGNLDRENTSRILLRINATDGTFTVSSELLVIITDVNDNKPIFTSRSDVSVEENTPLGTVIFQVRATDADNGNNSIITYSFLPSEYAGKFLIDASSGNITVMGNLDRENTSKIILRINATDGTFPVTSELLVIVTDVNDNKPRFTSRNNMSVEEDTPPGSVIFQVRAADVDYGNNSIITYSLLPSEYSKKFLIDASSGNITVTGNLDRENMSKVILRINATDGMFSVTSELSIIITDVNDNGPIFTSRNNISVEENTPNGTVIFQVKATDADCGINAVIRYSLLPSEYEGLFFIDSSSGNISVTGHLNREAISNATLHVEATDGKFNKTTKVFIDVLDVNEFPPVFSEPSYKVSIPENALVGDTVIHVSATDRDAVENRLVYSISSGNSNNTFLINRQNGTIFLQTPLDFEIRVLYELKVKATDNGIPAMESLVDVSVTVEDVNDSPPVFTKCDPLETPTSETQLFRVSASDADSGSNANITYFIIRNREEVCSALFIDHGGNVYSKEPLPAGTICNVTIRATDGVSTADCHVDLRVAANTIQKGHTGFPTEAKYSLIVFAVFLLIIGAIVLVYRFRIIKRGRYETTKTRYESDPLPSTHIQQTPWVQEIDSKETESGV